jgi:MOSC domain-containing protein YiiM
MRDPRRLGAVVDALASPCHAGASDPAVLKAIGRARQACLGVYGSVVAPGAIRVGDPVMLVP